MASAPPKASILSFEDARHAVEEQAVRLKPGKVSPVPLLEVVGRVLAEPVFADRDFPPFRRAARDGYAVRAADLATLPATLEVVAEIKAGASAADAAVQLKAGQAAAIMTGAPAPDGADAVVMVEFTSRDGVTVTVSRGVEAGANIVPTGSEAKRGDRLLSNGVRIDHAAIGIAAAAGRESLLVYDKPHVAVLATGDEIVDVGTLPGPTQIRNSNSYSLAAQIQSAGADAVLLPVAPDEPGRLRELVRQGLTADLLLLSGGVSMGKYDLVEQILEELRAQFFFTGAQIQPGKPIVFGRVQRVDTETASQPKYFLGLPGNPVSTMVTFELFARPLIEALAGMAPRRLVFLSARLKGEIRTKTGLKRFLPAHLSGEFERAEVELEPWQGSGDLAALARANCFVVIPSDRERIESGEWVPVLLR